MRLPLLLAYRFLKSSSQEKALSTMISICFVSIVLGTGSLTLVAAIMKGFEAATYKKLKGIHSDLIIDGSGKNIHYGKLKRVLADEYQDSVSSSSPTSVHHVMLQSQNSKIDTSFESSICLLKAIDPITEPQVSTLHEMMTKHYGLLSESLTYDSIALGEALAERLRVSLGSIVTIVYQAEGQKDGDTISLERKQVTVKALFKTGIHEFDEQVIIASYALVNQLYPERITHVALALKDESKSLEIQRSLQKRLSLEVVSWKDLYPPLISALMLERYAMWLILMLVTLVASLTIIALLYMYTKHKIVDIALLKSMGMADRAIKELFLWIATIITCSATFCGIVLAAFLSWLLNTYPFITLPDVYYVSHIPATLDLPIIASVWVFALLISICAGLFPNNSLHTIRITQILRGIGV
jgi:lipoprotein-releasing system permease protein